MPSLRQTGERSAEGRRLDLGLAIVKSFVEAHDGAVAIESTEGLGSTFRFTLPPPQVAAAA
jgi:signal transduction histidine kinase